MRVQASAEIDRGTDMANSFSYCGDHVGRVPMPGRHHPQSKQAGSSGHPRTSDQLRGQECQDPKPADRRSGNPRRPASEFSVTFTRAEPNERREAEARRGRSSRAAGHSGWGTGALDVKGGLVPALSRSGGRSGRCLRRSWTEKFNLISRQIARPEPGVTPSDDPRPIDDRRAAGRIDQPRTRFTTAILSSANDRGADTSSRWLKIESCDR